MRAKKILENYPPGAEYDHRAPWNEESSPEETDLEIMTGGYKLVTRIMTGEDDWETIEELEIDPCDMDELISFKLGIDFNKLQDEGDSFEIESIDKKGDKYFLNLQDAETVEVTYQELYDLYEKSEKRHAEWRKKFALGK